MSKATATRPTANPDLAAAMRELRQGSRTQRHTDRHANMRKGIGKGGRNAWKNNPNP